MNETRRGVAQKSNLASIDKVVFDSVVDPTSNSARGHGNFSYLIIFRQRCAHFQQVLPHGTHTWACQAWHLLRLYIGRHVQT